MEVVHKGDTLGIIVKNIYVYIYICIYIYKVCPIVPGHIPYHMRIAYSVFYLQLTFHQDER